MSILQQSTRLIGKLRDMALAQDCLLCTSDSGAQILCPACENDLPRLAAARCPQCALPSARSERCGRCLTHPPHYDTTHAVYRYDFPVDKLIQAFKYGERLALAPYFGKQLTAALAGLAADLLIPLPLHPLRLRERGFNQALELARPVSATLRIALAADTCSRTRNTQPQASLPWHGRVKNIRGAFHCNTDLTGKRIILVDDVMTTGATLNECARTLKLHGARQVNLLLVARALPVSS